ncbi:Apolipoprotein N-acyltransferase, partial [Haemophilus influenzae]
AYSCNKYGDFSFC